MKIDMKDSDYEFFLTILIYGVAMVILSAFVDLTVWLTTTVWIQPIDVCSSITGAAGLVIGLVAGQIWMYKVVKRKDNKNQNMSN